MEWVEVEGRGRGEMRSGWIGDWGLGRVGGCRLAGMGLGNGGRVHAGRGGHTWNASIRRRRMDPASSWMKSEER